MNNDGNKKITDSFLNHTSISRIEKRLQDGEIGALEDLIDTYSYMIPTDFITKFKNKLSSKFPNLQSESWNTILRTIYAHPGIYYLELINTPGISAQDVLNMEEQDTNHELLSIILRRTDRFYSAGLFGRLWVKLNILEQQRKETNNSVTSSKNPLDTENNR